MSAGLNLFLCKLPQRTMLWLLAVTAFLTAIHYFVDTLSDAHRNALSPITSLSTEWSIPSLFAGFLWVITASAAVTCFLTEKLTTSKTSRMWLVIAAVLIFASVDEVCQIHENLPVFWNYLRSLSIPLPDWAGKYNMLWQTLYAPPLIWFFVTTTRLLWNRTDNLPEVRLAFIGAIACFAMAIGCECIADSPLLSGKLYEIPFFRYSRIIYNGEEVLEDVATILMLFSFLKYATRLVVTSFMERNLAKAFQQAVATSGEAVATPPSLVSKKS